MALETLKDVKKIGGFRVIRGKPAIADWDAYEESRKYYPIHITDDKNMISFKIQDGPVKENGVNGCQVDTLIEAARIMIEGLNAKYPCMENEQALTKLEEALVWLENRKKDREKRGVEGHNKL